ncbi:hypothetical protein IIA95_02785 [Patescibacteria group bacterium]|nr:hypothetical protein [Patescibacteria group bacterium]
MHIAPILPPNPMDELEKNKKLAEQKLGGKELYKLQKKQKEQAKEKEKRRGKLSEAPKKIGRWTLYVFIGVGVIGGIGWFAATRPSLPPTTDVNHSEASPSAHIVTQPIPDVVQRHMLEHADGRGKPGIIIQYNCNDFECEPDLIKNLTELVKRYPDNVYLAPNSYDGEIILTKLGKRKILDGFDEQAITDFIE